MSKQRTISPRQASRQTRPIDAALSTGLFKALSDPTRQKLFACMVKCHREVSVSEVAECCDVDFSVVSRHLTLLAQLGILSATKTGRVVQYKVRYEQILATLKSLVEAIESCDCITNSCACSDKKRTNTND